MMQEIKLTQLSQNSGVQNLQGAWDQIYLKNAIDHQFIEDVRGHRLVYGDVLDLPLGLGQILDAQGQGHLPTGLTG